MAPTSITRLRTEMLDDRERMAVTEHIVRPLRTLNDVHDAAKRANLNPEWTLNHTEVLYDCPQCKYDGDPHQASATIITAARALVARCNGCNDDQDILGLLADLAPPWTDNVIPITNGNGTAPEPALLSWVPLDLVTLGDKPRVPPAISGIFYPGRRHILTGESESGKTWLAIGAAADELKAGRGVIWADLDFMGAQDILERLRQFGVPDDTIRSLFSFYQPDGGLEGYSLDGVLELIHTTQARLVILDAFTGLCHLHKLDPNIGIDIEKAWRLMQPLCDTNAAVGVLDHVVKTAENRGRYASGSERKLSGADVAIGFQMIELYGRGKTGRSKLTVHKDRPAMLTRPIAGIFKLSSDPDTHQVAWALEEDQSKGEDGRFRPTHYMEKVSRYLEPLREPASRREIISSIEGKDAHIRTALECLAAEGYTHEVPGGNRSINVTLAKHFREDPDE